MKIFISHSMDERSQFDNVADALRAAEISFWDPQSAELTTKLVDRVQSALAECNACVFVATAKSAKSYWCAAETAAFWGRGIPVFVYAAEPSFRPSKLPPHLEGHYIEPRLKSLVDTIQKLRDTKNAKSQDRSVPERNVDSTRVELSTSAIIEALRLKLSRATSELARVHVDLAEYERLNPGGSHTGMEGFEMACNGHVQALTRAIGELDKTQGTIWSLR